VALLSELQAREEARFVETHPRSRELSEQARASLFEGVPMHWMRKWPGGFPVFVRDAKGARFVDVDGIEYVDFCLGDTGAMTGHAPDATLKAVIDQSAKGITLMLPSEDALWVSAELTRRFGVSSWQFALTATDANRFTLRLARHLTKRRGVHAFILDTVVASKSGRQVLGAQLVAVAVAAAEARAAGCEWLHADFDDDLCAFYFDACGFSATNAGLIAL